MTSHGDFDGTAIGDRKGQAMWMQIAKRITGPAAEGKNLLRIAVDAALVAAFVLTSSLLVH